MDKLPFVNDGEMKVHTLAGIDSDRNPVLIEIDVEPEAKLHLYAFIRARLNIEWQAVAEGFQAAPRRSLDADGCLLTRATDAIQYMGEDVEEMNATLPRGPHYNDFALISVAIPLDFAAVGYMPGLGYPIAAVHPSEFSCEWHPATGVLTYNAELDPPLQ